MGGVGLQKKGLKLDRKEYEPLQDVASHFMNFTDDFSEYFNVYRQNVGTHARNYLAGLLMKAPRKNMERICEVVEGGGQYADYQHFISDSGWNHYALMERVAQEINTLLGGKNAVLCLDESGFTKKGKRSAGVARQYNGRLGKVDNCQVGVFASLCNGEDRSGIIDYRLFLPDEWIGDPQRCEKAGIPEEHIVKKTKIDHAYDMIVSAIARGIIFDWIAADAFYGRDLSLLNKIDDKEKIFIVDVPENFSVYLKNPKPFLPRRKENVGRKFKNRQSRSESVTVAAAAAAESIVPDAWSTVKVRETTKGTLRLRAYRQRIYTWDGEAKHARKWWLVLTVDRKTNEKRYILCNAEESVSLETMVQKHACRFWIERAFQDGKTSVGMADYQVRGWLGWHHHMAMVMLASLFMLKERLLHKKSVNLLSCQDIVELLTYYLPRKDRCEQEVFNAMIKRHTQRKQAVDSAKRKRKLMESSLPK
jgi:SRSO17 transposase